MSTLTLLLAGAGVIYTACMTPHEPFRKRMLVVTVLDELKNPVENAQVATMGYGWPRWSRVGSLLYPRYNSDAGRINMVWTV